MVLFGGWDYRLHDGLILNSLIGFAGLAVLISAWLKESQYIFTYAVSDILKVLNKNFLIS